MKKVSREVVFKKIAQSWFLNVDETTLKDELEGHALTMKNAMEYVKVKYQGTTNWFLSELYQVLTCERVEVVGEVTKLYQCPCCLYHTLSEEDGLSVAELYAICPYCSWENDGTTEKEVNIVKSINRGSISQYRKRMKNNPNIFEIKKWES